MEEKVRVNEKRGFEREKEKAPDALPSMKLNLFRGDRQTELKLNRCRAWLP